MANIVNFVGLLVAALCAVLLLRAYMKVRLPLLLWSGLCFSGLTIAGALLFVDLVFLPREVNLYTWRLGVAAVSHLLLLYGLIWKND